MYFLIKPINFGAVILPNLDPIEELLTEIFSEAKKRACGCCVLRNHESLPKFIPGNDIDVSVIRNKTITFKKLVMEVAKSLGWLICKLYRKNYRIIHVRLTKCLANGKFHCVRFDIMSGVGVQNLLFFSHIEIVDKAEQKDLFMVPSKSFEFAIIILTNLFERVQLKTKYNRNFIANPEAFNHAIDIVSILMGRSFATKLHDNFERDGTILLQPYYLLRAKINYFKCHPFRFLLDYLEMNKIKIGRYLSPPGYMVVFLGPDGVGKSTLVLALQEGMKKCYPAIKIRHLRPTLLPGLGKFWAGSFLRSSLTDRSSRKPPTNDGLPGLLVSLTRLGYYSLDYVFGYWLKIRVGLAKDNIYFFDRYYHDYFYDQTQKQVNLPDRLLNFVFQFYPSPKFVFCLCAKPKTIKSRRADLELIEIRRQLDQLRRMSDANRNIFLIDCDQSVNDLVFEVMSILHGFKVQPCRP